MPSNCILLGYWALLSFVKIGPYGGGDLSAGNALNAWFDQHLLPGIRYQNLAIDPEGLLSNVSSIVNALAGVFIGRYMIKNISTPKILLTGLFIIGISVLLLGYLWGIYFVPLESYFYVNNPHRILLYKSSGLVSLCIMSSILIPHMGISGAAVAVLFAKIVSWGFIMSDVRKHRKNLKLSNLQE